MDRKYEEIINNGKKDGKSIEQINKELKEAGATFHINPNYTESGWTQKEMDEGFIPAKEEAPDAVHLHDLMRYKPNMAGLEGDFWTCEGHYHIKWNENGNPVSATRIN